MTSEPKRNWTQHDIVEETRKLRTGPGFFNTLSGVCDDAIDPDGTDGQWQFPMGDLTVGQLLDFFSDKRPSLKWHNEFGGPTAYVVIGDYNLAEAFRDKFKIGWLRPEEEQQRSDEDFVRAAGLMR